MEGVIWEDADAAISNKGNNSVGQWDFQAPMYVDFASIIKPGSIDIDYEIDDSSYFSIDHECHRGISLELFENEKSCVKSINFCGSSDSQDYTSAESGNSSTDFNHNSPTIPYSKYHSSPNLTGGRYVDVIADVPANRQISARHPDIIVSPSKDLDCTSDEEEEVKPRNAGAVTGTWCTAPTGKPPVNNKFAVQKTPTHERGRQRFVAAVTSAKKRLSMSVDRGRNKLSDMKQALAGALHGGTMEQLSQASTKPSNIPVGGKLIRFGSSEDITNRPVGNTRRRILSGIDNLPPIEASEMDENGSEGGQVGQTARARLKSLLHMRRSVPVAVEDFVVSLTSRNEAAVTESLNQNRIAVPHSGIPFCQTATKLTMIKPFSFWRRDAELIEKRERKRLQVIAEEKKAREFHAQPFPDIIYRSVKSSSTSVHNLSHTTRVSASSSSGQVSTSTEKNKFKAKPPTVLTKPPFIPQKSCKPPTEIMKKFEMGLTSRMEKIRSMEAARRERVAREEEERAEREKQKQEAEQDDIKRQRMKTVHRAQPVPAYLRTVGSRHSTSAAASAAAVANTGTAAGENTAPAAAATAADNYSAAATAPANCPAAAAVTTGIRAPTAGPTRALAYPRSSTVGDKASTVEPSTSAVHTTVADSSTAATRPAEAAGSAAADSVVISNTLARKD